MLFTGFLVENQLKSSTVKSYISAMQSVLSELNIKINKENYLLKLLTKACRLQNDVIVHKLPVTKGVLKLLLDSINKLFDKDLQPYLEKLYAAIYVSAFYGLLRIGEVAKSPHAILARNVQVSQNENKILFILKSSKTHNKGDKPQLIKVTSKPIDGNNLGKRTQGDCICYCPFRIIQSYIAVRPAATHATEQFFIFSDRSPVMPAQLRKIFNQTLQCAELNQHAYTFHCMHAGRASQLLKMGISVETIKQLGHRKSNAVFAYLRN